MENLEVKQLTRWQKVICFILNNKWRFIISFIVGCLMMVLYNVSNGVWDSLLAYIDGSFIGGFVLICVSMLTLIEGFGGMDIFSYQVNKKKFDNGTRETLYDYTLRRKKEREGKTIIFVPYLSIGLIFILFSIVAYLFTC